MNEHSVSRRDFLAGSAVAAGALATPATAAAPSRTVPPQDGPHWLDGAPPATHEGQCWGYPWPRGTQRAHASFRMMGADGKAVPLQSWPMAYWPDGSLKWTGHAIPADTALTDGLHIESGRPAAPAAPVTVAEQGDAIEVSSGPLRWRIARSGPAIILSARNGQREVLRDVRLVATAQDRADEEDGPAPTLSRYESNIEAVAIEQRGPVRAVLKVDGKHRGGGRDWLPFSLRLTFHAGSESVRIVHSFVFDGDPTKDFIRGLGLSGAVPMADAPHDRHLRFAGEKGGLWGEAVKPLTGLRRDTGKAFRTAQIAGLAVPPLDQMPAPVREGLPFIPTWGDVTLSQPNSDGFTIVKRTKPGHGWIDVDTAGRAPGLGYVGGASGGVAFGMHDFWQRCPTRLDIRDAATDTARFTLWHHSPSAPAMDLRIYHDDMGMTDYAAQNQGLDITYEDFEPGWGDAHGIARTTEFRLWALPATPARERLVQMAETVSKPPRLIAASARIKACDLFGIWSFPDRSTPMLAAIEERAQRELDFYLGQVDQRRWYGFWNYGDVMHSYDDDRHVWRYDIGGFAWDNSELSSDLWLWYGYLRTGRADIFRMAEAMTRHTGEVDVYHLGRFKGLGTRHGVQHWSDSSKQPRISNAAYRRFYYYLTADERCGDLMRELLGSEAMLRSVDIGRKVGARAPGSLPPGGASAVSAAAPLPEGQIFLQFGTSWGSLLSAWLTEWERTHDTRWRDRIVNGMQSIAALPKQWFAGGAAFDLATGRFLGPGDTVSISHLNGVFGVFETTAELFTLVDVPAYRECWLDYCQYYNAPEAEFRAKVGAPGKGRGLRQAHSRYTAYAAVERKDAALARRAWAEFLGTGDKEGRDQRAVAHKVDGAAVLKPIDEISQISTNDAAQWGLAADQNIALIGKVLAG
ncbi:exo-rhamnogalacturonan lyase family protein [Sphingomonas sp. PR090111-T3T-6A]|uniref:exo-rhamnogalacturonan lyase family protein n=1 Tax=Sphingomonas sp. PR090111-T3T-6A TaxID=685778 RepID=UPI00037D2F6B|nr:twin-arginine translocation signal domain-containing protein [Sphingomonas sp. PR090111-T3T-6A]